VLTAVLLVLAAGLSGCGSGDGNAQSAETSDATSGTAASAPVGKIINVEVQLAEPTVFDATIRITGVVESLHDAVISAEEGGRLLRYLVEKGAHVDKGQPIARLDDSLLRSQVKEAEAAAALAHETYERRARLWQDEKIGSEITYLQAKHEADRLDAAVEGLRTRLARTTIKAPFAGIFDEDYLDVGEMAAPGTPVARVIGVGELRVTGGVPERFARDVSTDTRAAVTFAVVPGVRLDCPVTFVGSSVDAASRTFTVELGIDDPPSFIKPAMVANIELVRTQLDQVFVVPQSAVSRTETGFQVFVIGEDESGGLSAVARPVQLGPSQSNRVVIESGLARGERVIVLGKVDDHDRVRIVAEHGSASPRHHDTMQQPLAGSETGTTGNQR
jgi:RND family efflux transporter MFP subunit